MNDRIYMNKVNLHKPSYEMFALVRRFWTEEDIKRFCGGLGIVHGYMTEPLQIAAEIQRHWFAIERVAALTRTSTEANNAYNRFLLKFRVE